MQKSVIFVKKILKINILKIKNKFKNHYHEYRSVAAHSLCNLKYSVPKEIPIVFHNRSNYDYHVIIKELAEEYEVQFNFLEEILQNTSSLQFQ